MPRKFNFNLDDDTDMMLSNISKASGIRCKSTIIRLGIRNLGTRILKKDERGK